MRAKMGLLSRKRRSEAEGERAELWSEEEERRPGERKDEDRELLRDV